MNKIIIITGTRKGIGRYLSEYYLRKNFIVIGCSRCNSSLSHDNYEHFCLDVADEKAVTKMVSSVSKKYKKIDFLINNAGIASMNHSLLTPLSIVEKIFRTNVYGSFLFCREVAKIMSRKKTGRIVNFTTVAVPLNLEGEAIYAASKSAIESLTRTLSKEFGINGITVNAIGPSPIQTDLIKNIGEEKLKNLLEKQALKKKGLFEDVSNIIDFYISDNSQMVSGQVLYIGGVF